MNSPDEKKRRFRAHRWLVGALFLALSLALAFGADPPEAEQAYQAATNSFKGKFYERAQKEFAQFVEKFPQSSKAPEAILLQAQCLFELKEFGAVVDLLSRRLSTAGELQDQYRFWLAEAEFYRPNLAAAAQAYQNLLDVSTNSSLRLQASYGQAWTYSKLRDLDRAIKLLSDPARPFQQAAQKNTNDTVVARGHLLLAETYFSKKDYRSAEQVLMQLASRNLSPELDWERQYLLATSTLADQRPNDALVTATNLVALASNTNLLSKPVLHANSLMLMADILKDMKDRNPGEAIAAYEQITKLERIPANQKQQALLRIVDLLVSQNRFTNAIQRLVPLLGQTNQDTPVDLIRVTLGDLYLKQFYSSIGKAAADRSRTNLALSNFLHLARVQFDDVIKLSTNRPLVGKACLNRGWCLWEEARLTGALNKFAESQAAFQVAADRLPDSEDRAIARFKLADCQFQQRDFPNAVKSYRFVIDHYADLPEVKNKWLDQAFYQMLRAGLESADLASARVGLNKLLEAFPTSEFTARSVLSFASDLLNRGSPDEAREARDALRSFQKRVANSPWLPEARLAIARSYTAETNWTAAISEYDQWLGQYTNHTFRPQAEFDRAWTHSRAGYETNALALFADLVGQFPTNPLAHWARIWVGDYYFNQQNYTNAENNYQLLFRDTNVISSELRYRAGIRAGRAALLRNKPSDARGYLTVLLNALTVDTNRPADIEADAWFLLGDVEIQDVSVSGVTNGFERALVPFQRITNLFPTIRLVPIAQGRIADCYLQLAAQEPKSPDQAATNYFKAMTNYYAAMTSPLADVPTRSQAEVGLATALEKLAELKPPSEREQLSYDALNHCLNVVYGKKIATDKGELPDPFWVSLAWLRAAKLAESLQMIPQAVKAYESLLRDFPQLLKLQPNLRKKLEELKNAEAK